MPHTRRRTETQRPQRIAFHFFIFRYEHTGGGAVTPSDTFEWNVVSEYVFQFSVLFNLSDLVTEMQPRDYKNYANLFQSTHHLIDVFRAALPPLTRTTPVSSPVSPHGESYHFRTLLLAHALVDAAIIKLHGHFAYAYNAAGGYAADSASRQYCLDAAKRIVAGCGLVSSGEVVFVSPIMGVSYRATLDGINLAFYPVFPECTGSYILSSIYDSSNVLPPKKE